MKTQYLEQILAQIDDEGENAGWLVLRRNPQDARQEMFKMISDEDGNIQLGVYSAWQCKFVGSRIDRQRLEEEVNLYLKQYNSKGITWSFNHLLSYFNHFNEDEKSGVELNISVYGEVDEEEEVIMNVMGCVPKASEVIHIAEQRAI